MAKSNHIRSISVPNLSHPNIQKFEEQLNKLRSLQVSATPEEATICSSLLGLEQLYNCIDDLLNLPQTLRSLSENQNRKRVYGILEKSVNLLDVCCLARDVVSQLREKLRDLESSLKRKKDSRTEACITEYRAFVKKMNKDAKKSISALKRMDDEIDGSTPVDAIRSLREARTVSISVFQSVLLFLSLPISKPKPSKCSLVSKLVQSGRVTTCDNICTPETLEAQLEAIENKMEIIFRWLIKFRSSLLNIISC